MSLKWKVTALRIGPGSRQHVFMSAGVVVAAVVLVSFLTWLNDAHKPIVRSIEEAVESSLPEALEQVDDQVAMLLGVDEESVRSTRESLAGLVTSRPGRILEIATGQPVSASSAAPASAAFPTPGAAPASEDPSSPGATDAPPTQTTSEPSPTMDTPPPATSEPTPPPATDTPPPATEEPSLPAPEEPSPPAEVPSPPATEEPPPAAGDPAPPGEEFSPPAQRAPPPAAQTLLVLTEGNGRERQCRPPLLS